MPIAYYGTYSEVVEEEQECMVFSGQGNLRMLDTDRSHT